MNRPPKMESAAPQTPAPAGSTVDLFLAWLAMPELNTPVQGPARANAPARRRRRRARLPEKQTAPAARL